MGLPVTIYRYTDAGAPQLTNGTPSEWMDILKKVLVTGYGTKAGLGWTMEFENAAAYKIAFRNKVADGGSGGYVQFWSATGANAASTSINMKTAQSMSALDTFIKPGAGRQLYILGTTHKGWEIIGTSRGFYIMNHLTTNLLNGVAFSSAQYHQQYFIGDIESSIINDQCTFILLNGNNSSADAYSSASIGISWQNSISALMYGADGSSANYMYIASKPYFSQTQSLDGNAESLGVNHTMVPVTITGVPNTVDAGGVMQNNSVIMPFYRGVVPGFYMSSFAGYRNENWPTELTHDGVKWVLLRSYYYTGHWIKTGTWYD